MRELAALVLAFTLTFVGCGLLGDGGGPPFLTPTATPRPQVPPLPEATLPPAETPTLSPVASTTYTVQAGDTLSAIARRFGTTVEAIVAANNLTDPDLIQVGQELVIPQGGAGQ